MLPTDPRRYQIAVLASLLTVGMTWLEFDVAADQVAVTLGAALAAQALCARVAGRTDLGLPSALISGLSLCLLLRTADLWLAAAASVLAIGSKFAVAWRGKHLFNPTNIAIVGLLIVTERAWVSSGQWGHAAVLSFAIACLGLLVVTRAARLDVTAAFLLAYGGLLFARAATLGDPIAIPMHGLSNGALLLFAFFMISDPKTTPDSRAGRVAFALTVALGAYWVQFGLFRPNGLLWSLAASSPLVPLLDRLMPGPRHAWPRLSSPSEENSHETVAAARARRRPRILVH